MERNDLLTTNSRTGAGKSSTPLQDTLATLPSARLILLCRGVARLCFAGIFSSQHTLLVPSCVAFLLSSPD